MVADRPIVHLICTAHLDPVWMWPWEEGLREAISTFHTAVDLLDAFPEFVFNHNESLLYEWVEEYDPTLFARITRHVMSGHWNITGGWYLQPDCNMLAGETLVRLILEGRRYFEETFGVRPTVAYNFDTFGHPQSLPQILKQSGFEMYIHFRPNDEQMPLPGPFYRWQGMDGSEVLAVRPNTGWYCTPQDGQAREQALNGIQVARETGRDTIVLWGLGDHGGGATRAELEMFRELLAEYEGSDIIVKHSTPEAFLGRIKPYFDDLPLVKGELQRTLAGTYTSVASIKRQMRRGEALLMSAERAATIAWWLYNIPYPATDLRAAWKQIMFNSFHDILCGSLAEHALPGVNEIYGAAKLTARRILVKSHHALVPSVAPNANTIPLYVLNLHAAPVSVPVGIHFMSAYAPPPEKKLFSLYDEDNNPIAYQTSGGPSQILEDGTWQPFCGFKADLPPTSVTRYEIRFEKPHLPESPLLNVTHDDTNITIDSQYWHATFSRSAGALTQLTRKYDTNKYDLLTAPAQLAPMQDVAHGWGGENRAVFNNPVGNFRALTPQEVGDFNGMEGETGAPVRIVARGSAWVTVECLVIWQHTRAAIRYTFYADLPYVNIHIRLYMQARRKMIKMQLPFALHEPHVICEVPYGTSERPADATEHVYGRWLRLTSQGLTIGLANDGQYGFDVSSQGLLNLSLSRGGVHSAWEEEGIPTDKSYTWMDQERIDTQFRLLASPDHIEITDTLPLVANTLNQPPDIFFSYHLPTPPEGAPEKMPPFLQIEPETISLGALKKAEDDDALIIRLIETTGRETKASIMLYGVKSRSFTFAPYQIRSFKFHRDGGEWMPVNLLEEYGE